MFVWVRSKPPGVELHPLHGYSNIVLKLCYAHNSLRPLVLGVRVVPLVCLCISYRRFSHWLILCAVQVHYPLPTVSLEAAAFPGSDYVFKGSGCWAHCTGSGREEQRRKMQDLNRSRKMHPLHRTTFQSFVCIKCKFLFFWRGFFRPFSVRVSIWLQSYAKVKHLWQLRVKHVDSYNMMGFEESWFIGISI